MGTSLEACIVVFIVGGSVALAVTIAGLTKFPAMNIPLGSTSSAAISPARHLIS